VTSVVERFFRHCPACGRRFEVRLVSKAVVNDEGELEKADELPQTRQLYGARGSPIILSADSANDLPELRDREEIMYDLKCKHCGHEWTEARLKTTREKTPPEYTGD